MRSNRAPLLVLRTSSTVRLMSANTPMPERIVHNTVIMTTPAIPRATDSRNDSFMTDHGSTRETLSLTRRGPVGAGAAALAVAPVLLAVAPAPSAAPGGREPLACTAVPD